MKDRLKTICTAYNSICYFPNATNDFRELFYLSSNYQEYINNKNNHNNDYYFLPDLFILSDNECHVDMNSILNTKDKILFKSNSITIKVKNIYELDNLDDLDLSNVNNNPYYGKCYFMTVKIDDKKLGSFITTLIYCFIDSMSFIVNFLIKNKIRITHFIHTVNTYNIDNLDALLIGLKVRYLIECNRSYHKYYSCNIDYLLNDNDYLNNKEIIKDNRLLIDLNYAKMYRLYYQDNNKTQERRNLLFNIDTNTIKDGIKYLSNKLDKSILNDTDFLGESGNIDKEILDLSNLFKLESFTIDCLKVFNDKLLNYKWEYQYIPTYWDIDTIYALIYVYNHNRRFLYNNYNITNFNEILLKVLIRLDDIRTKELVDYEKNRFY